jgi:hypothetical protein
MYLASAERTKANTGIGGFKVQVQQRITKTSREMLGRLPWKRWKTKNVSHFPTARRRSSLLIYSRTLLHLEFERAILHFVQDDDLKRNEIDGFKRNGIGYSYFDSLWKGKGKKRRKKRACFILKRPPQAMADLPGPFGGGGIRLEFVCDTSADSCQPVLRRCCASRDWDLAEGNS